MTERTESYDLVVCGGGLAGFCAAVAAARCGAHTCLVHDRPVFGGNSSSEVRVGAHGAASYHAYARETGIISELLIEERARNHELIANGLINSVWDMVLYDMAQQTPNLTFYLNTTVEGVEIGHARQISAVTARVANAELRLRLEAKVFADCTGDGTVAALAGCEWRMGTEARAEFGEPHAPEQASADVMGSSLLFRAVDVGRPVPFHAPSWAVHYNDPDFFYKAGRLPRDPRSGYWWIELGAPWNTISDNEQLRHELTRHLLGVWDWIKNRDPYLKEKAANFALDWVGQVPGKRESRRIMGLHLLTENDIQRRVQFPDEVAFGGWFIDLHSVGGLLAADSEPASAKGYGATDDYQVKSLVGPYGIPLRSLIARDVNNLMMAGRNFSATHAALGTARVMLTTAAMGQAIGTAAAIGLQKGLELRDVPQKAIVEVQQQLLRDGCFLPSCTNQDPLDVARQAKVSASSEALLARVGPESKGAHNGLGIWNTHNHSAVTDSLVQRRGQLIALGTDALQTLSVCLSNGSGTDQQVEASLYAVDSIWDYRVEPGAPVAGTKLIVPPGQRQWIDWPVELATGTKLKAGRYLRLDLHANPNVEWHRAGRIEPGHVALFEMGGGLMRRYDHGITMSFGVQPPQPSFGPTNVLSGVTRPHQFTNLWRSDPALPMPQWLQLEWAHPELISRVEITFPGHLLREYWAYQPFYQDPQCPRDYGIYVWEQDAWQKVAQVEGNYQRHCRHVLDRPVYTDRLRVVIEATNGDPSAAIYEVRCYR